MKKNLKSKIIFGVIVTLIISFVTYLVAGTVISFHSEKLSKNETIFIDLPIALPKTPENKLEELSSTLGIKLSDEIEQHKCLVEHYDEIELLPANQDDDHEEINPNPDKPIFIRRWCNNSLDSKQRHTFLVIVDTRVEGSFKIVTQVEWLEMPFSVLKIA